MLKKRFFISIVNLGQLFFYCFRTRFGLSEPVLSLFSFRRAGASEEDTIAHLSAINEDGRIYLTQTRVGSALAIRFQAGSFAMSAPDIDIAYSAILDGLGLGQEGTP